MKRIGLSLALAICLCLGATASVVGGGADGCAAAPSGFRAFAIDQTIGDGVPPTGGNAFWDMSVVGLAIEGLTPLEAARDLGFDNVAQLYEFVQANLRALDKNRDNAICAKPFPPHQNGTPAYFFNGVDNSARPR